MTAVLERLTARARAADAQAQAMGDSVARVHKAVQGAVRALERAGARRDSPHWERWRVGDRTLEVYLRDVPHGEVVEAAQIYTARNSAITHSEALVVGRPAQGAEPTLVVERWGRRSAWDQAAIEAAGEAMPISAEGA